MIKIPCKSCEKRSAGCHIDCIEYKEYQKENEKIREEKRKTAIVYSSNSKYRM